MIKGKLLALIFTSLVIFLLVSTGPVQGLSLDLKANTQKPEKGDKLTFTAEVSVDSKEHQQIDKLTLHIEGDSKIICTFDANGIALDGCSNIKISKSGDAKYGYGYGYGYGFTDGKLIYKIEVDTSKFKLGSYSTQLKIKAGNEIIAKEGPVIKVESGNSGGTCGLEWICGEWSPCASNVQYRTCHRNLNYCELEPKPEETRVCLSEEPITPLTINSVSSEVQEITPANFASIVTSSWENLQFIIILLLMNCIITTINIIVKVQERRYLLAKRRKLPKMPSPNKVKKI